MVRFSHCQEFSKAPETFYCFSPPFALFHETDSLCVTQAGLEFIQPRKLSTEDLPAAGSQMGPVTSHWASAPLLFFHFKAFCLLGGKMATVPPDASFSEVLRRKESISLLASLSHGSELGDMPIPESLAVAKEINLPWGENFPHPVRD